MCSTRTKSVPDLSLSRVLLKKSIHLGLTEFPIREENPLRSIEKLEYRYIQLNKTDGKRF